MGVFHLVTTVLSKAVGALEVWPLQWSSVGLKGSKSVGGNLKCFKICFGVKLLASYGNFEKLKTHFFSLSFGTTALTALSKALDAFKVWASRGIPAGRKFSTCVFGPNISVKHLKMVLG